MKSRNGQKKMLIILPFLSAFLTDVFLAYLCQRHFRLVSRRGIVFTFKKCLSTDYRYFSFYKGDSEPRTNGSKYSLTTRHINITEKYGIKRKDSMLNTLESKSNSVFSIIEVSFSMFSNEGFKELYFDRRKLYFLSFERMAIYFLLAFSMFAFVCRNNLKLYHTLLAFSFIVAFLILLRAFIFHFEKRYYHKCIMEINKNNLRP